MKRRFIILGTLFVILVLGGGMLFAQMKYGGNAYEYQGTACPADAKMCPDGSAVGRTGPNCSFGECPPPTEVTPATTTATTTSKTTPKPSEATTPFSFSGTLLAGGGNASPLLEFNKVDYDKAVASGALVVLFFTPNWDQFSRIEFEAMQGAFNSLPHGAIGFRMNFNDSATSADERMIERELGVTELRTKLLLKNEVVLLKTAAPWTINDFSTEIRARI